MSRRAKTLTLAAVVAVLVLAVLAGVLYLNPWWTDAIDGWPAPVQVVLGGLLLFPLGVIVLCLAWSIPKLRQSRRPRRVPVTKPCDDIDAELAQMIAERAGERP